MIRVGTGGQQPSADDDVRTLTGSRLDTYLRIIRRQINDAAQAAKDETARFAHETFANLIEQERTYLENRHRYIGTEPSLAFGGNGLPDVASLRERIDERQTGSVGDELSSMTTDAYERIESDEWAKRIRKDRIAKRQMRITLTTGPHDGLELRIIECAYRDCLDKIGRTTPIYVRNAVTEYQIAFGELFWKQQNEHFVVRSSEKAFVKPAALKKYDTLWFYYALKNRHLDTPVTGIFRRHRIPDEPIVKFNCSLAAGKQLEKNVLRALRPLFEPHLYMDEKWIKTDDRIHFKTVLRCGDEIIGKLYRGSNEHDKYPAYSLEIHGEHLRDDEHVSRICNALAKKNIIP